MAKKRASKGTSKVEVLEVIKETSTTTLAVPVASAFGRLANVTDSLGEEAEGFPTAPFIGFYTDRTRQETAKPLMECVGAVSPGQAYIKDGEQFWLVDDWRVCLLAEFKFYGEFDWTNSGRIERASLTEADDLMEAYLTVTLHIPPAGDPSGRLGPVFAVSRSLKSQVRWVRDMARAINQANKPQFIKRIARSSPELAQALGAVPERFRVAGSFVTEVVPTKKYSYLTVNARSSHLKPREYDLLARALSDPDTQEQMDEMLDLFDLRKAEVEKIIAQG